MALSVVMPALEMAQETGKLLAWRKKEGDKVAKGEPLLEIETDKAVVEIEAPGDGVLAGISAEEGTVVPVGQTIAWIVAPGEKPPAAAPEQPASGRATAAAIDSARPGAPSATAAKAAGPRISPKARRLAQEQGVDISLLRGTGPDGAITTDDVMAAAQAPPAKAQKTSALSAVARLMAERTTQSWTTAPHFFVTREADAGALLEFRDRLSKDASGSRPTIGDLLVALVARVLTKHPRMYASWTADGPRPNVEISIAVAVAVEEGVIAPVIRRADAASLAEIAARRRDLADRARSGRLRPEDLAGATFTVSNLGMYEVDAFTAILPPGQSAILAVGGIRDRVVARDGKPAVRPTMSLTLSSDHRVVDGARAADFMRSLVSALEHPAELLR